MNDTCICDNAPKVWRLTGVTRTLRLRIFNPDGTPLDLTGRTVGVTIARDNSEFVYAPGFVIEGDDNNVVKFEWPADQQGAGDYTINVTTTDGSGNADRVNWHGPTGIRLVDFSFMVRGEDALGVTSEANIGLDGTFTMNGAGMSAYDEWLVEGHTGTPEDFIAWLRQPAEDAATEAVATVDAKMAEVDADMAAIEATAAADHTRAESDHTTATGDHTRAEADHVQAVTDSQQAATDHQQAEIDAAGAASDREKAATDRTKAANDRQQAAVDHGTAAQDHATASSDHQQAQSDHSTASADHTQATSDHTRAGDDHDTAVADHQQAEADHTRAEADHTTAAADHTTAAADHTQAAADHEVMAGYDTRLGNVEGEVSQLGQKLAYGIAYTAGRIDITHDRVFTVTENLVVHLGGSSFVIPRNSTFSLTNISAGIAYFWAIVFDTANLQLIAKRWDLTTKDDVIICSVVANSTTTISGVIHCVIPYKFDGKFFDSAQVNEILQTPRYGVFFTTGILEFDSARSVKNTQNLALRKWGTTYIIPAGTISDLSNISASITYLWEIVFDTDALKFVAKAYNHSNPQDLVVATVVATGNTLSAIAHCVLPYTLDGAYFTNGEILYIRGAVKDDSPIPYSENFVKSDHFVAESWLSDYLYNRFILGYTHNGTGTYSKDRARNAIITPVYFDRDITINSDGNHDFALQFYDGPLTGSAHLLQATGWMKSYVVPANKYWCIIVRNNNNTITTEDTTRTLRFTGITNTDALSDLRKTIPDYGGEKTFSYFGENVRLNRFAVRPFVVLGNAWAQSMAIYGDYAIFFSEVTNKAQLYNIKSPSLLATFNIPNGGYHQPHGNTAVVGVEFASQNSIMPAIYLSQWDAGYERACFVLDVSLVNDTYTLTLVQKINLSGVSASIIGEGECDFVVDRLSNKLYAISYKTSVYNAQGTSTIVCEFSLPALSAGSEILLADTDVVSSFETELVKYRQDAFMWNDNIFICNGGLSNVPASLSVINIYKKQIVTTIPLGNYQAREPECLDLYNNTTILYNYGVSPLLEIVL